LFVSHPKAGYRLVDGPDSLMPEKIIPFLQTVWLGKPYQYADKTSSTNDYALKLGAQGAPHGSVIAAGEQLAGRGRLSRRWISPPHCGVYVSMILRDSIPCRDAPKTTIVAALSLMKVLRRRYDLPASIKWPNDVLIHGKKVAGILTEMESGQDTIRFLVVGIGINVNQTISQMKAPFRYPATSLAIELGCPIKRSDLLLALLKELESDYDEFRSRGFVALLAELEHASSVFGRTIKIQSVHGQITGKAAGLTVDGALRITLENGQEKVIWDGDIVELPGVNSG
jgi:BirA family biotin operon repressor/biotin-[acetyl-CoA-carboxylase] ligase